MIGRNYRNYLKKDKKVMKIPDGRSEANLLANVFTRVVENSNSGLPSCKTIALTTRSQVAVLCKGTSLGLVLKTTVCNVLTLTVSLSQDM